MKNTSKYSKLYKSLRDAYNDLDEDSYYEYQRNGMQIPLPFTDDEGNQLFYKANLPASDLGEFLSNPIKKGAASLTPVLKAPIEMTTGKSLYTGEDSNYNVLKNKLNDLGVSSKVIQSNAQAAETILNNYGLQNVSTNLIRKVQAIIDGYNGDIAPQQVWAEIFRSVVQNANQENVETSVNKSEWVALSLMAILVVLCCVCLPVISSMVVAPNRQDFEVLLKLQHNCHDHNLKLNDHGIHIHHK